MTNTLCIETSGAHCSLALSFGEQIYSVERQLHRSHNQHLLGLLDELFTAAGAQPKALELVAFGCGPGSFTGVRIAAAACQAIALASDAMVVAVPSSLALALSAQQAAPASKGYICSIKSRGEAYYLSTFVPQASQASPALQQAQDDELVDAPPAWLQPHAQIAFTGVGAQPSWWPHEHPLQWLPELAPRALDCMAWVKQQHAKGASQPAELALPRYIAGDSPWKKSA